MTKSIRYKSYIQASKPFRVQGTLQRMYTVVIETPTFTERETFYSKAKAIEYMNAQDKIPIVK